MKKNNNSFKPNDLAALRLSKGYSQRALALALGCSQGRVAHWESKRALPSLLDACKLSQVLDYPLEDLARLLGVFRAN